MITLSKHNQFANFFTLEIRVNCKQTHITSPTTPKVYCRITVEKSKFKFATSCAPYQRLVNLLWCLSASQSLASRTSSLSIQDWRSTAAITATRSCDSSCCPWCATCQAISSSFNNRAHLHTGHVSLCDFLSQHPLLFLQICGRRITLWRPAASASGAAAQHWRTEWQFHWTLGTAWICASLTMKLTVA